MANNPSLSKEIKKLLVNGYVRGIAKQKKLYIPQEIQCMCHAYFDPFVPFIIRGKELKRFLEIQSDECDVKEFVPFIIGGKELKTFLEIQSDECDVKEFTRTFKYDHDIQFKLCLNHSPKDEAPGFVDFSVFPIVDRKKISEIRWNVEMKCDETNSYYREACMCIMGYGWPYNLMRLSECVGLEQLEIDVNVQLDCVKYNDGTNWIRPLALNKYISFVWMINQNLLNKFRKCESGKCFWSDTFGGDYNWVLLCLPNGRDVEDSNNFRLELQYVRAPTCYQTMDIKFEVVINKKKFQGIHSFVLEKNKYSLFDDAMLPVPHFSTKLLDIKASDVLFESDGLEIEFKLEILKFEKKNI